MLMAAPRSSASAQTPPGAATSKTSPSGGQIEQEIRAIEQQEAQALLRGDASALERLWAPDLLVTASNNTIRTGAQALGFVKSGQLKLTKLDRRVERVAVHGQVAVAMGAETIVPAGGKNAGKTLNRRYTDVYAQQAGQWRLIARQQTLVPTNP
jgi:uncharacterized protein (TIGR02246 family)